MYLRYYRLLRFAVFRFAVFRLAVRRFAGLRFATFRFAGLRFFAITLTSFQKNFSLHIILNVFINSVKKKNVSCAILATCQREKF